MKNWTWRMFTWFRFMRMHCSFAVRVSFREGAACTAIA